MTVGTATGRVDEQASGGVPPQVTEQVTALSDAVRDLQRTLAAESAWRLSEADLLQVCGRLARLRSGIEATYLQAVAEVDRRRAGGAGPPGTDAEAGVGPGGNADGVRGSRSGIGSSTESFLRTSAPLTPGQARADVAAARALAPEGTLHELAPQLTVGDVTRAHVDVATRCLDRIPAHLRSAPGDRAAIAEYFADLAPTRHARELQRAANALLERLAPEAVDRFDPKAHERRYLDITTDVTGMSVGHFAVDAVAGAALRAAIDAASAPRPVARDQTRPSGADGLGCGEPPEQAWAVLGVAVDADGRDTRSARQRRADALHAIAVAALGLTTPQRGERPRIVVHANAEQFAAAVDAGPAFTGPAGLGSAGLGSAGLGSAGPGPARTEAGQDIGPEALRRLSCDAVLQRVVWDRDGSLLGSVPLDLGRETRLADRQLRRALAARDRGCIVPGCGARPSHCDAHHVVHWADGGRTCLLNLVLLCGSHHTAVHAGTWAVRFGPDGIPEVVPPHRVDPLRRPRRAPHHDAEAVLEALRPRVDRRPRPNEHRRPPPGDTNSEPPEPPPF